MYTHLGICKGRQATYCADDKEGEGAEETFHDCSFSGDLLTMSIEQRHCLQVSDGICCRTCAKPRDRAGLVASGQARSPQDRVHFQEVCSLPAGKKKPRTSRGVFYLAIKPGLLALPALQDQGGVGAAEAEAVAHHVVQLNVFAGLGQYRHVSDFRVQLFDVGGTGNELAFHHQQAVDRFVNAGGAQGVTGQALGRTDDWGLVAEDFTHTFHFRDIADRSRGAVGVQVVDRTVDSGHGHLHATDRAFAAWRDHVVAVGGCTVADDFRVDLRATGQSVFELLDHHHAATASDDKTVTLGVVGAGGLFRGFVVLGGQRAHGVEQERLAPMFFFTATGEDDVLLAHLDLLQGGTDAVSTGGAGGGDRVVQALDLERRGQARGNGAAHGTGHAVWTDALDALLAQDVQRFHLVQGRGAARAGHQAGTRVGHLLFAQTGVGDGVFHGQVGVSRRVTDEAIDLAIDQLFEIEVNGAGNLATQTHFGIFRVEADARAACTQVSGDGLFVIAQARNDAQTSDNDAAHANNP